MNETLEFLVRHGPGVLFAAVFVEQMGVPLPAAPWLLAAGALAATDNINWFAALAAATFGSLLADLIWFYLGRYGGHRVLDLLCRISLEPDSFVYPASFMLLGALFSGQLEEVIAALASLGSGALGVVIALAALYIGYKYYQRQRLLKELRMARITVDELHQKLETGENPIILDLRSQAELERDPSLIR